MINELTIFCIIGLDTNSVVPFLSPLLPDAN